MRLRQTSKTLCAFILLGALVVVSAPSVSAQPFGSSSTVLKADVTAESPSIFQVLLDWLAGGSSADSDQGSAMEPEILDFNGGTSGGTDDGGDGGGDAGGSMDPLG